MKDIKGAMLNQFIRYSPDWLFAPIYSFYSLLLSPEKMRIRKAKSGWLIKRDGLELLSPTPKFLNVGIKQFEYKLERHFKIEKGDIAVDVGACIGDTTVPMAMKIGSGGRVFAVEPDPHNVKYLRLNLATFPNAEVIEKGVWRESSTVEFHLHNTPTGHSIMADKVRTGRVQITVDTLDNLFGDVKIDFAKIDVQGAEEQVLLGGDNFLKTVPKLVVETHDRYSEERRTYPRVLEILRQYDFKIRFEMDNGLVYAWR